MRLPLIASCLLLACGPLAALAAADPAVDAAQAQYQQDLERCQRIAAEESRAACLREAAAARDTGRRGDLTSAPSEYERNRVARCQNLPPADRKTCLDRLNLGTPSGSVEGGGVLREHREIRIGE